MTSYLALSSSGQRLQRNFPFNTQAGSVKPTVRSDGSALVVGDRWWDTSDRVEWWWNGAFWLSSELLSYSVPLTGGQSASSNFFGVTVDETFNLFIEKLQLAYTVASADASNRWNLNLRRRTTGNGGILINSIAIMSASTGLAYQQLTINTHFSVSALEMRGFDLQLVRTGTPANIAFSGSLITWRYAKP